MPQDVIFDRVGLAQPHEHSWPAAPYHASILRNSIQHEKYGAIQHPASVPSKEKKHTFFLSFPPINRCPSSEKKFFQSFFCPGRLGISSSSTVLFVDYIITWWHDNRVQNNIRMTSFSGVTFVFKEKSERA